MDEKKQSKAAELLKAHYEKIGLVVAAGIVVALLVSQFLLGKKDRTADEVKTMVGQLQGELGAPHPQHQPPQVPDYVQQAKTAWDSQVPPFNTSAWPYSYQTRLKPKLVPNVQFQQEQEKARIKWILPVLTLNEPEAALDQIKIVWTIKPHEEKKEEPLLKAARVTSFVVERLSPPAKPNTPAQWEKLATITPEKDKTAYEYIDKNIKPKTQYHYRVRMAVTRGADFGTIDANEKTTPEKSARTRDIWALELEWVMKTADTGMLRAKISVTKFEMSKGKWFAKEFTSVEEGDWIGGTKTETADGELKWTFDFDVNEVPPPGSGGKVDSPERAKVRFETKYRVLKIEPEVAVKIQTKKHIHDPKDKTKFEEKIEVDDEKTAVVTYRDDEGKERKLYRRDPAKVYEQSCSICEGPSTPTPKVTYACPDKHMTSDKPGKCTQCKKNLKKQ